MILVSDTDTICQLIHFYTNSEAAMLSRIRWTHFSLEWICQGNFLKGVAVPHVTKNQIVTDK